MKIEEAQVANMLAESLVIDNTTTVDGSQARLISHTLLNKKAAPKTWGLPFTFTNL